MRTLKIPKYLEERFDHLQPEDDLIDDCKYLLFYAKGWGFYMGSAEEPCSNVPVRSKAEAIEYLKDAYKIESA